MLTTILIIAVVFLGIINIAGFYFLVNKMKAGSDEQKDDKSFLLIQDQLHKLTTTLDNKVGESSKGVNEAIRESSRFMRDSVQAQFSESQKLIKEITEELSQVKETGKQVVSFADQLKNLQDILKNPKQRGVLGEYYLETVLKNVLPPERFQMQYKFENGEIVDAVVFLEKNKILPIDSKFSLENYNRLIQENDPQEKERIGKMFKEDLKRRIDETA
ncbi:DNA recombination protein RmuC, partial [Patescibacteria group bacterium]